MIKINAEMPNSCADCFACGMHDLSHAYKCRLTGEELPEIKFYDLLATKNPKMKNCPLQEDASTLKPCPFCSSAVELKKSPMWRNFNGITHGYTGCYQLEITCPQCGCSTSKTKGDTVNHTEEQIKDYVVKNWNTRDGE